LQEQSTIRKLSEPDSGTTETESEDEAAKNE